MEDKINELEDLLMFFTNNKIEISELGTLDKNLIPIYKKVKKKIENKKGASLINEKIKQMDEILTRIIYTKEKLILKNGPEVEISELSKIIDKYINYPFLISKNNNLKIDNMSQGIDRMILLVTHSCQLRCKYCSVRKFEAEMDEKTMQKSIDLLFTSNKKELELQFFGGEPLLRFELVKKGVEYTEKLSNKKGKKIKFILTTNGIALSKDRINYLKKHKFSIEFSIDGDKETQLRFRKSLKEGNYYDKIIKNLKELSKKYDNYYVISVVTPENIDSLYNNFKYLLNEGITKIQLNYALGKFWNKEKTKKLLEEFSKIKKELKKRKELSLINLLSNRREPVVLNAEVTVDCDGTIYLETGICLEEDFNKLKEDFKIGNIHELKNTFHIFNSRSRNLNKLVEVYSKEKSEFRGIILNNIEIGIKLKNHIKENKSNKKQIKKKII